MKRSLIAALCNIASLSTVAADAFGHDKLTLRHGLYVSVTDSCKDAPNADILFWDGVGFSGAHSSRCTSHVLHQQGKEFQINTTCTGIGDGSEDRAASPYVDSFGLTQLSALKFKVVKSNQVELSYRWCGATNTP